MISILTTTAAVSVLSVASPLLPARAANLLTSIFTGFDPQAFLITILVLCVSLSFHEMAHAWAANKMGDDTAALQGRLTMNPLAHLDPIGSLLFIIGGIGWAKPVPINPNRFTRSKSMKQGIVLTSLAGPASNLLLSVVSVILVYIIYTISLAMNADNVVTNILQALFVRFYQANIILAVFNLLPVPPLDGYKIFGALLPGKIYYKIMSYERYIGMAFLLLVLFGRGVLSVVLNAIVVPFNYVIFNPIQWLFELIWKATGLL